MSKLSLVVIHTVLLALLLAASHGILKWVSLQPHESYLRLLLEYWYAVLLALSVYGFVFFYYILVLRTTPVSILYPIYTGLSVMFVLLIGHSVFSEPVSVAQVMGIVLVVVGIVLIGASP